MLYFFKNGGKRLWHKLPRISTNRWQNKCQTKIVKVSAGEQDFDIEVKNYLSLEEKTALIQKIIDFVTKQTEIVENDPTGVILMIMVLEALTDIEFPEDPEAKVAQLNWLIDLNIPDQLKGQMRPGIIDETLRMLNAGLASLKEAAKVQMEKMPEE